MKNKQLRYFKFKINAQYKKKFIIIKILVI